MDALDRLAQARAATALVALLALGACTSVGQPYVAAQAGIKASTETHNDDELETGSEKEPMFGAAIGTRATFADAVTARVELEATYRKHELHGRNGPGCNDTSCSADHLPNNTMRAVSLMANAWPEYALDDRWALYAGGGVGGAYVTALGDEAIAPAGQVGAGVLYRLNERIEIDLGYRYWSTGPIELDDQDGRYATHGPTLRAAVKW